MILENEIYYEDLDSEQKELADIIGMDSYTDLVKYYGGANVYIPKLDTFQKKRRNERMKDDFSNGLTFRQIAYKYTLTEAQARRILMEEYHDMKSRPPNGQLSLFDIE